MNWFSLFLWKLKVINQIQCKIIFTIFKLRMACINFFDSMVNLVYRTTVCLHYMYFDHAVEDHFHDKIWMKIVRHVCRSISCLRSESMDNRAFLDVVKDKSLSHCIHWLCLLNAVAMFVWCMLPIYSKLHSFAYKYMRKTI